MKRITASAIGRLTWVKHRGMWYVTYPDRKKYKVTGEGVTKTEAYNDMVYLMRTNVHPENQPYLFKRKYA